MLRRRIPRLQQPRITQLTGGCHACPCRDHGHPAEASHHQMQPHGQAHHPHSHCGHHGEGEWQVGTHLLCLAGDPSAAPACVLLAKVDTMQAWSFGGGGGCTTPDTAREQHLQGSGGWIAVLNSGGCFSARLRSLGFTSACLATARLLGASAAA